MYLVWIVLHVILRVDEENVLRLQVCVSQLVLMQNCKEGKKPFRGKEGTTLHRRYMWP